MDPALALLIIALVYAIGDLVSAKTKALLSMLFVAGFLFLIGFWTVIPKTLFADAQALPFAMAIIPMLLVHMGSLLNTRELKEEWKTVLIALTAVIAVTFLIVCFGWPIIGRSYAISAVGPITGGVAATLVIQDALTDVKLETFATLLLVLQSFVGLPIASYCLSREAQRLLRNKTPATIDKKDKTDYRPKWRLIPAFPKAWQSTFILIMKTMLIGWLSVQFAHLLNDVVHRFIMALLFGIVFTELGFLEHEILDKAKSTGLLLFVLLIPVFDNLTDATPSLVLSLLTPIVLAFLIASVGIVIVTLVLAKMLKCSWALSMAIGFSCMIGFPGTFIISEEVAAAQSKSEEEREFLLAHLLPKMLVAGFTTVTVVSVIIAGVLVRLL
jgi:hypothetical protein